MRFPLLAKTAAIGVVTLCLVWALGAISGIVSERAGRMREAQRNAAESLSTSQTLLGPVLQRKCNERWESWQGEGKDRKTATEQREFNLVSAPRRLTLVAVVQVEPRQRGIFRINGYTIKANLAADWSDLNALQAKHGHEGSHLVCSVPILWVAVSDTRGIRSVRIELQDHEQDATPGTPAASAPHGFQAALPQAAELDRGPIRANVALDLVGTEDFAFAPIGDATQATLSSDWPHPSFNGRFLPASREVSANGFSARWQLSALASRAAQDLREGLKLCQPEETTNAVGSSGATAGGCIETFGVSFMDPLSPYVLSDRATKYGLLFIALTFVAVGLVEVMRRLRVHPVQYLLVGCALTLFFLLLVSLSEHVPFSWAYLAASSACTVLLTYYGVHVLRSARAGLVFGAGIGSLYGALYVLLLREQSALVLGAMLLFAVLSVVMVITRKIDWYQLISQMRTETANPDSARPPLAPAR